MKWMVSSLILVLLAGLAFAQSDCHQGVYAFSLDGASFTAFADDYQSGSHDSGCTLEDFFFDVVGNDFPFTITSDKVPITKFGDFSFPEGGQVEVTLTFVYEADEGFSSSGARLNVKDVRGDTINSVSSIGIPVTAAGGMASIDLDFKPANDHGVFFGVGSDFGTSTDYFYATYSLASGGTVPSSINNAPGSVQGLWQSGNITPVTGSSYDATQGLVEDIFDVDGDDIGGIFQGETPDGTDYYVVTPTDDGGPTYIIETDTGGKVGTYIKAVRNAPGAETAEVVYGTLVFGGLAKGNIVLTSAQNKGSFQGEFPEFEVVTQEEVSGGGLFGLSQVFAQPFIWMGNVWNYLLGLLFGAT